MGLDGFEHGFERQRSFLRPLLKFARKTGQDGFDGFAKNRDHHGAGPVFERRRPSVYERVPKGKAPRHLVECAVHGRQQVRDVTPCVDVIFPTPRPIGVGALLAHQVEATQDTVFESLGDFAESFHVVVHHRLVCPDPAKKTLIFWWVKGPQRCCWVGHMSDSLYPFYSAADIHPVVP